MRTRDYTIEQKQT